MLVKDDYRKVNIHLSQPSPDTSLCRSMYMISLMWLGMGLNLTVFNLNGGVGLKKFINSTIFYVQM